MRREGLLFQVQRVVLVQISENDIGAILDGDIEHPADFRVSEPHRGN